MPDDFDLQLQRMMAQFQPTPEEIERAKRERMLAAGFGLLGTRKGQEFENIGRAGLFGQGVYNDTVGEGVRGRQQAMQGAGQALQLQQQMRAQREAEGLKAAAIDWYGKRGQQQPQAPQQPLVPPGQFQPTSATAMMGGATTPNPQAPPAPPQPQYQISPKRRAAMEQMAFADHLRSKGYAAEAAKIEKDALALMPEVHDSQIALDPRTKQPVKFVLYKDGSREILPYDVPPDTEVVDTGGVKTFYDKRTQKPLAPGMPVTNTPAQEAAIRNAEGQLGVSRRNAAVNEAAERRAGETGKWATLEDRAVQVDPRTGVTRPLIDQTGTPLAPKGSEQLANMKRGVVDMADRVLAMTTEATTALNAGGTGTGTLVGKALRNYPGSPAFDLKTKLESIKANLGFEQLQALRNASPTGGALGAVSEQENRLLQSTIASLDPDQSEPELRKQIAKVEHHLNRVRQLIVGQTPGPQVPDPGAPAQQQRTGTIGGPGWSAVRVSPGGR